jgi:hypothetical protein
VAKLFLTVKFGVQSILAREESMSDRKRGSRLALQTCLALVALLCVDLARPVHADEVDDTALAFVQQRDLGNGLGWLGYQVASRTAAFAAIVDVVGKTEAQELVQSELQRLQPDYQTQWNRHLAAAYAHVFTAEELRSLNQDDGSSSQVSGLKARNNQVGIEMKARSSELLASFVDQALDNARKSLEH